MMTYSLWDIVRNLLLATRWTIGLSLIAFIGGGVVGLILLIVRIAKLPGAERGVSLYVHVFQGTPLLMQLFLTYFGLALLGFDTSALASAALCLTLHASAYLTEIWRGSVESVPKGQWEASSSLAMSFRHQLRHIILPQALRVGLAPTVGFLVQVVKGTALASVIGFVELLRMGELVANVTFRSMLVYAMVGAIYFCLCYPLTLISRRLERKLRLQH